MRVGLLLTGAVVLAGCAGTGEARRAFIHQNISDYVFEKPAADVTAEARRLLDEHGYFLRGNAQTNALVSDWKEEMGSSNIAASYSRYLVEVFPVDEARTRVRIHRNTMSTAMNQRPDDEQMQVDRSAPIGDGSRAPPTTISRQHIERQELAATDYADAVNGKRAESGMLSRDLQMEWLLLQRLQPEDAKELQALAETKIK